MEKWYMSLCKSEEKVSSLSLNPRDDIHALTRPSSRRQGRTAPQTGVIWGARGGCPVSQLPDSTKLHKHSSWRHRDVQPFSPGVVFV